MATKILHITNGDALTAYLKELNYQGKFLTWREMLCEGPTLTDITSEAFFKLRTAFLKETYQINYEAEKFKRQLQKLDNRQYYSEINLWFEYDLFCHINLMAVLYLLKKKKLSIPVYLISSGRIKGEPELKGLAELNPKQINAHFKKRITLNNNDLDLGATLWQIYCSKDHNLFKPYIVACSNFKYLANCLKAHLRRFPHQHNGLSMLEEHILKIIKEENIKSQHHLLGYSLNYKGYYGLGDMQLQRLIKKLSIFYTVKNEQLVLNRKGHEALLGSQNFAALLNNSMVYGGVNRLQFQYNSDTKLLIKTNTHAG